MNPLSHDAAFQKRLLFAQSLLPLGLMLWDWWQGKLGANPVEFVTRATGVLALLFMIFTLLVTPLRKLAGWSWLARHRRTLGLFAFFYGLLHALTYAVFDRDLRWSTIPEDVWKRPFIAVGALAFLLMVPLAATSTNAMIKRLGGKRWSRLHKLTYLIAVAGVAHYWMIVKSDIRWPLTFAAAAALLLGYRLLALRRAARSFTEELTHACRFPIQAGGLVADGVTPLLFKMTASTNALPAGGVTYELAVKSVGLGTYSGLGGLGPSLRMVNGGFVQLKPIFHLTPSQPTACAVLGPIQPENLNTTSMTPVIVDLEIRELGLTKRVSVFRFGIRKPPIALVHGYNADKSTWGFAFLNALHADRGADFVVPISYGTETDPPPGKDKNSQNTSDPLISLAGVLDRVLRTQLVELPELKNWAFSRYDAVGHSQGGVLLRMLCSKKELMDGGDLSTRGFEAFANAENLTRGRFRRVVTIGSPHAGSTLGELGYQLRKRLGVDFGNWLASVYDEYRSDLDPLFQPKFRIGSNSQLNDINRTLQCDPAARLHLLQATIYGGNAPGSGGSFPQSLFYKALYVDKAQPTVPNPANNQDESPGVVVAPNGSDGVVDTRSQTAGGGSNRWSAVTGSNISHAVLGESETSSSVVAQRVSTLLNGPASQFGMVTIPQSLKDFMEDRRMRIETLALAIRDRELPAPTACYLLAASASAPAAMTKAAPARAAEALGDQTLNFTLQPPLGESPNGPTEWTALVFGPSGVSAAGLTFASSGTYGEQLALTVAASVQGQVVLAVRFPSTTGKTVIGRPQVVLDRPPGSVLLSIVVTPAVIELQAGTEMPLTVSGIYDGTVSSSLFTNSANTAFQSSNAPVATVDADGRVTLLALGTATITATYNGMFTATTAVTVLDVAPIVTSAATVSGLVGQAFTHQLTASQMVQTFAAASLPPGLTLNAQTGQITGTPTTQGATSTLVSVTNANGTGSKQLNFTITGPPGAPMDVGLDATGVSEQKPVGTLVGRLATIDPNPLDTFTYQFVSGLGATHNASFGIAADQLFTAAVLSRTVTPTVSLRVQTTDSTGATFAKVIVLPVMAPPAITRQPDPRTVFTGENAIFAVETTGLEPLSYRWQRNGVDVPGAASRILEVAGATVSDAGDYTATVWNGDGTVTSAAATLIVNRTSYGKWASALPQTVPGSVLEPTGDYNGDGLVNFLEFAFGVQPNLGTGLSALPTVARSAAGIVLKYREANGIEPLVFQILKSTDLLVWTGHEPAAADVTRIHRGNYSEVQVRLPDTDGSLFLKIRVGTP